MRNNRGFYGLETSPEWQPSYPGTRDPLPEPSGRQIILNVRRLRTSSSEAASGSYVSEVRLCSSTSAIWLTTHPVPVSIQMRSVSGLPSINRRRPSSSCGSTIWKGRTGP